MLVCAFAAIISGVSYKNSKSFNEEWAPVKTLRQSYSIW